MTEAEVEKILRDSGALLDGHFILRSGLRSRRYFQCSLALQQPSVGEQIGGALADKMRGLGAQTVIAPAVGGLIIGHEIARQLGLRFIFVEVEAGRLVMRRGFKITPGEKVLVIDDVVGKGGRVREAMDLVSAGRGVVVGVGMIVDRSKGTAVAGVPMFSLLRASMETFSPDNLPPDLKAMPATIHGSK